MAARRTRKDDGSQWTAADSRSVYGIRHWGAGYFAISDDGRGLDADRILAKAVSQGIVKAVEQKRDVVYLPGFWRLIMLVIRHIPETIFKRLSL